MLSDLLDVLAPPACVVCRTPPPSGDVLCAACRAGLPWIEDPCPRCALPRVGGRCSACPAAKAAFSTAWAPLAHAGTARDLVLALKLRGAMPALDVMAAQIASRAPAGLLDSGYLVPVPGHEGRRRQRGFDVAYALSRVLLHRGGRGQTMALLRADEVARLRGRAGSRRLGHAGSRQLGRGRGSRSADAPEIVAPQPVPFPVVLVDDVHTTGATLDACARALRAAGCPQVAAVTYVRTLTTP